MRTPRIAIALVALALAAAAAAPAAAQSASSDVSRKAAETAEAIRNYAVEKKDEAVGHAKKLAADVDAAIRDLEAQASKQAGEAKAKSERAIKDLKARRAKAAGKVDELAKATKASWEDAKKGVADAYRDLAAAVDRAVAEVKK